MEFDFLFEINTYSNKIFETFMLNYICRKFFGNGFFPNRISEHLETLFKLKEKHLIGKLNYIIQRYTTYSRK